MQDYQLVMGKENEWKNYIVWSNGTKLLSKRTQIIGKRSIKIKALAENIANVS